MQLKYRSGLHKVSTILYGMLLLVVAGDLRGRRGNL
jgi:hypothetical protein